MTSFTSHYFKLVCLLFTILFCLPTQAFNDKKAAKNPTYETLEWDALMPKEDLEAILNPPNSIMDIADGSALDRLDAIDSLTQNDPEAKRFFEAMNSSKVVETLKGKRVKLPGFVVPLSHDKYHRVTEFFIVPYFGACLHMPPPPPNQMIFVKLDEGIVVEDLYIAFWFEGTMEISSKDHALGSSAYTLKFDHFYEYML
ncbi:MAG: DUF3299 domain-containing protein [Psychrobium sp.]